jgi:hypothetical protein
VRDGDGVPTTAGIVPIHVVASDTKAGAGADGSSKPVASRPGFLHNLLVVKTQSGCAILDLRLDSLGTKSAGDGKLVVCKPARWQPTTAVISAVIHTLGPAQRLIPSTIVPIG